MKRIVITVTVDDDIDSDDVIYSLDSDLFTDPTVWEWEDFWLDVKDDLVNAKRDGTATR